MSAQILFIRLCVSLRQPLDDTRAHTHSLSRIHLPALPETERQYVLCYRATFVLSGCNRISDVKPYLFSSPVVLPCPPLVAAPVGLPLSVMLGPSCSNVAACMLAVRVKVAVVVLSRSHPRLLVSQPGIDTAPEFVSGHSPSWANLD